VRFENDSRDDAQMSDLSAIFRRAVAHHQAGELGAAAKAYGALIDGGVRLPLVYMSLGAIELTLERYAAAAANLRDAVRLDPANSEAHANLGHALAKQGDWRAAAAAYGQAANLAPNFGDAWVEQGVCLEALPDHAAAETCFERACAAMPNSARAHALLARARHRRRALDPAIESYRAALAATPDAADLWNNLGAALHEKADLDAAEAAFRRAIALDPRLALAHANLGALLLDRDERGQAKAAYAAALALAPGNVGARMGVCFAELPILYEASAEIDAARAAYARALDGMVATLDLDAPGTAEAVAAAVGLQQPFFLPYQARNDAELQRRYGAFVSAAMARTYPDWSRPLGIPPRASDGRLRIGFVTGYFRQHSIWKLFRGWIENLDRARFAVTGYMTATADDAQTRQARAACDAFVEGVPGFEALAARIFADRPHALIYPEIGMDPIAHKLAALRLAPVQCTSWGHPETSGLPTIDWFLTSDLMEPPGEAARYSERVLRLPGLSIDYAPPAVEPTAVDAAKHGLREGAMRFLCCQSIFKYLPQDDDVLARIAAAVPDSQFVFLGHPTAPQLTQRFRARLAKAFAARGASPERQIAMLPPLDLAHYAGLNRACDLFLDSLRWSGGNTALEAIAQGLPVLTWPGDLMRGRHSAAILAMAGLDEGVATSPDDYVEKAVAFAKDRAALAAYAARTVERRALLWRDARTTASLGDFLARVCGP
jgi:predicted O-linked N-acetylglucosamine transferase (SPINDLY family)